MNDPEKKSGFAWSLWIPVILLFLLVSLGWYVRIQLAAENPIEFIEVDDGRTSNIEP
ncbi:MAG: hypothetical protein ACLFU4_03090 [Opitutales bacterium]